MKKLLLNMLLIGGISTVSSAQVLIIENFTGFTAGNLGTQGSWVQTGSGTDVQVGNNSADYMFYPNYVSGSQYVTVDRYTGGSSGTDPYKAFLGSVNVPANVNSTFFMSFVINVTGAQNGGDYCLALRSSGGNYLARFFVKKSGSNIQFGVSSGTTAPVYTTNYATGTTYLIMIRQDIVTGSNNDNAWLWVNPTVSTEPSTAAANAAALNGTEAYTSGQTIDALAIRQGGNAAPAAFIDGIKVAYGSGNINTAADATAAWTDLSPEGIPLPVTFDGIKAFKKANGVQIDWSTQTEVNIDHYEVERSNDGRNFLTIGNTTPRNLPGQNSYTFFDANPATGTNFYRIRNIDLDGRSAVSPTVKISLSKAPTEMVIFPNPFTGNNLSLQLLDLEKGNYRISVLSGTGQTIMTKIFVHEGGVISQTLQLPVKLQKGLYSILVTGNDYRAAQSLIVQ
ncbi:MAG: T9SS type A sorting domain-containing protein [Terrimonas sp.]|nr:T9SS type A sorting domain-containing protein [Terrimonas sp.]